MQALAQPLSSDAFFREALQGLSAAEIIQVNPVDFPWLEGLDLRTETRDFDLDQQEITLRLSPSTPKKRRAQTALLNHYGRMDTEDQAEFYADVILNLYGDWISLYFMDKQAELQDSLILVMEDKQKVLDRKMNAADIDLDDLFDHQVDLGEALQARYELKVDRQALQDRYGLEDWGGIAEGLKEIDDMSRMIRQHQLVTGQYNDTAWKSEEINREIALEEAERDQYFDFLQFRYRGPSEDLFRERFSLGLGFQWNNNGNRDLKVARLLHEKRLLEAENKSDAEASKLALMQVTEELRLEMDKLTHFVELNKKERLQLTRIGEIAMKKSGFDPILLLDIKEHMLESKMTELEMMEDLYFLYLKFLSMIGMLSQTPFVNHIKA